MEREIQEKRLAGIILKRVCPELHHLFFTNDSLFFFQGTGENARHLKDLITKYCRNSGQRINEAKSSLTFNRGAEGVKTREIEEVLHISSTNNPGKYLGLPAVCGRLKREALGYLKNENSG